VRGETRAEAPTVRAQVAVIAAGVFATALGWPALIGRFPLGLFLKNELHMAPQDVAAFWSVATLAWYVKPLWGLVCDAHPLFGFRRFGYLLVATVGAGLAWLALAVVPRAYAPLLVVTCLLVLAEAFVSTVVGGMLVETGQRHGATGRLSSLRQALVGVAALAAGPLGGWLAERALGWTAAAGAALFFATLPAVLLLRGEPRGMRPDGAIWARAGRQLGAIARSRAMWAAGGLLFLANLAPSLQTPLLYYQQDVLSWSPQRMGVLQSAGAAGALAGAAAYSALCRRLPLGRLLPLGIALNVVATLSFLGYRSLATAAVIHVAAGVLGTLAVLPLYDLGARAAPKGSESLGFALLMSAQTLAMYGASDVIGSYLYGHLHFSWQKLVLVNAAWTAAVALYLPLIPRGLVAAREGGGAAPKASSEA
jgi:Na+/melibiose symporter-like transporter